MKRKIGTVVRGIRAPIVKEGDDLIGLRGEKCVNAMRNYIKSKDKNLVGSMASQGTTPRQLSDLLGSLCDLTSGSGDKGTPIVLIQGYFDNYASD